jgi:XTP/dITP diphosphohydrolase
LEKLIFATNNANKVREVNVLLEKTNLNVVSLSDMNFTEELQEDFETLQENAQQKARFVHQRFGIACFSEDTGLEIHALNGRPGVNAAHYSGSRDANDNMDLVLQQLENQEDRTAQFRTVICLKTETEEHLFEGICKGKILTQRSVGDQGFGYDPIFLPDGYELTFAQMDKETKSLISHRGKAMQALIEFLSRRSTV